MLPGRARSTGLGPLLGLVERPAHGWSRSPPETSGAASQRATSVAGRREGGPTRRPRSKRPAAASTSCQSRSRAPGAGTPTGCRCAGRTGSRTEPAGQEPSATRRPTSDPAPATTARSAATVRPTRSTDESSSSSRTEQRASEPTVTPSATSVRTSYPRGLPRRPGRRRGRREGSPRRPGRPRGRPGCRRHPSRRDPEAGR